MKIRFILTLMTVLGLYLIVSFARDLWQFAQKENEIAKKQLELERLQARHEELEEQWQYTQSAEFVERQAREKLGLTREGETVLILPENLGQIVDLNQPNENKSEQIPNWEKWWKLFF